MSIVHILGCLGWVITTVTPTCDALCLPSSAVALSHPDSCAVTARVVPFTRTFVGCPCGRCLAAPCVPGPGAAPVGARPPCGRSWPPAPAFGAGWFADWSVGVPLGGAAGADVPVSAPSPAAGCAESPPPHPASTMASTADPAIAFNHFVCLMSPGRNECTTGLHGRFPTRLPHLLGDRRQAPRAGVRSRR